MAQNIEIERKFLIEFPDIEILLNLNSCQTKNIEQTYLTSLNGSSRRLRKMFTNGTETYIYTQKTRISEISCIEEEYEISREEYNKLFHQRNLDLKTIKKTRYCLPFKNHTIEIDIYPFWTDRAILEIELSDENEHFEIPDFLHIIKEVSQDKRYKNISLAREIISDQLK